MTIAVEGFRSLRAIAKDILVDWRNITPYAKPYAMAMLSLNSIKDKYYLDSGSEIVARFLSNAGTWRGDVARSVKQELKVMLAKHRNHV